MTLLTKSKYMNGMQCPRLLWLVNQKKLPLITLSDQHKFNQGYEVEKYAKSLFPEGHDLKDLSFEDNINKTKELIKQNKTIFEASIIHKEYFVRSDVLNPNKNGYDLYEIKATTEVKNQHIIDLAFQKFVLEKEKIKINNCYILNLNKEYVKNGNIDPQKIISFNDVTDEVNNVENIEKHAKEFLKIIKDEDIPEIIISPNCNKPYECPFKPDCWSTLPEYNVLQLTNWRLYWKLFEQGIIELNDVPNDAKLNEKEKIILEASVKNKIIINKDEIKNFLTNLNYPLYYFDFETFDTAIPIYDNSRPYQKIPFQYSLHIEKKDGTLSHKEYLATGNQDPRIKLLEQLKEDINGTGDIIVFNKAFEISVLNKLAIDFPNQKEWIDSAIKRIIDLADIFSKYYYYNPVQKGSYSIKKVLPALTDVSYKDLDINNGGDASVLYFMSHISKEIENKDKIRKDLLKYCTLDTKAMVDIVHKLNSI